MTSHSAVSPLGDLRGPEAMFTEADSYPILTDRKFKTAASKLMIRAW
jgi:hypothetical protein